MGVEIRVNPDLVADYQETLRILEDDSSTILETDWIKTSKDGLGDFLKTYFICNGIPLQNMHDMTQAMDLIVVRWNSVHEEVFTKRRKGIIHWVNLEEARIEVDLIEGFPPCNLADVDTQDQRVDFTLVQNPTRNHNTPQSR